MQHHLKNHPKIIQSTNIDIVYYAIRGGSRRVENFLQESILIAFGFIWKVLLSVRNFATLLDRPLVILFTTLIHYQPQYPINQSIFFSCMFVQTYICEIKAINVRDLFVVHI